MAKLVVFNLGKGDFTRGFSVTIQIGEEGDRASTEILGQLPPNLEVPRDYAAWQSSYSQVQFQSRLGGPKGQSSNYSQPELLQNLDKCRQLSQRLSQSINKWLNADTFRPVKEKLLNKLEAEEEIRLAIQTGDPRLRQLPWHLWDFFDSYPKAEATLSAPEYDRARKNDSGRREIGILAILGNSQGIDVAADRAFLEQLPGAEVTFLVEPERQEINDKLWEQSWEILFFAGHSRSEGESGRIFINSKESLTLGELKSGLAKAVEGGLQLGIFNSCDGLGLARELEDLHVPQVVVMREPVPDRVAQEFLKHFLRAFAAGYSLYLAARSARERLSGQGLEEQLPGCTWLPVICQNPAEVPLRWSQLGGISPCPYRGLAAFRQEDAEFFFGREAFVEQLVAAVHKKPLVAAIGPSGSGKSSTIFAGLIPQLQQKTDLPWQIVSFRPGNRPFEALAAAIVDLKEGFGVSNDLGNSQQEGERGMPRVWSKPIDLHGIPQSDDPPKPPLKTPSASSPSKPSLKSEASSPPKLPFKSEASSPPLLQGGVWGGSSATTFDLTFVATEATEATGDKSGVSGDRPEQLSELFFCSKPIVLKGHKADVTSVSFSPDGKTIATGSQDRTVKLWTREGQLQKTLWKHGDWITDVSFSPDGKTIASASWDKTVQLWSRDGENLQRLRGHDDAVNSISFSPDGKTIASGSGDRTTKLWNIDREELRILRAHNNQVASISFSSDGKTIATASLDTTAKLWSEDGRLLYILAGHNSDITGISFSPDNSIVATGSRDRTVKLWSRDGQLLQTLEGHTSGVTSISFSPDGSTIASGSRDKTVKLWHRRDGVCAREETNDETNEARNTSDRQNLLPFCSRPTTLRGHEDEVTSVSFSPDGATIASASRDKTAKLWQQQDSCNEQISEGNQQEIDLELELDLEQNGEPDNKSVPFCFAAITLRGHSGGVNSVTFSSDGNTIATASKDRTTRLWNQEGKELKTLQGHDAGVTSVSFSPYGDTLATAGRDGTVKLWSETGEKLRTLERHENWVTSIRFSPDGKILASSDSGGRVILWRDLDLDLDELLGRSCDWLGDYLKYNPNISKSDRGLCDDFSK